jgi:HEAT repeat protein
VNDGWRGSLPPRPDFPAGTLPLMSKCPTCGAAFTRTEYCCRECGHILREVVSLRMSFASRTELQEHFGRYPTFASLFLPVAEALPEGTLVELRLALPEGADEMSVPARVVGAAPTPSTPATPFKLHLNLLHIDAAKKTLLKELIAGEPLHPPAPKEPSAPPSRSAEAPRPVVPRAEEPASEEVDLDLEALLAPLVPAMVVPPALALPPPMAEPWAKEKPSTHLNQMLGDFVVRLAKALTATTYYEADHQAAMKAKLGLYDTFKMVVQGSPEVSFLNQAVDTRRSVLVYGIFDEPKDLERVMAKGQADLFVPKLAAYMESRNLLSMSFKRALEHAEFYRFVDLLATPVYVAKEAKEDLATTLAKEGISNISLVLKEDHFGPRKLSWRVAAAITRLKKDLSVLPYFASRPAHDVKGTRFAVFRDVVRPLRQLRLVRELLANSDLISEDMQDLSPDELEQLILEAVAPEALPELLSALADDVLDLVEREPAQTEHLTRLTRTLARKLAGSQGAVLDREFRRLHDHGVLGLEDLPPAYQDRVRIQAKASRFMENWSAHLKLFDEITAAPLYQKHLDFLLLIYAELLARYEMEAVTQIGLLVAKHRVAEEPFPGRRRLAASWISSVAGSPARAEMVAQLMAPDRVRREALMNLCGILGEGAVPVLFEALCDCPSRSIRLEVCELLVGLREPTMLFLAAELEKKNIPWYFQRNLLNLLGRIGDVSSLPLVGRFMSDKHPRVRLEALLAACSLDPASAESNLLWGIADQDPDVRGVSLRHLVQRRSTAPELFEHCRQVLSRAESAEDEGRAVCNLLTSYQAGEGHEEAVELLVDVLRDEPRKSLFGFLQKPQEEPQLGVRISAIQALGRLRARKAVPVLTRLSEGRNQSLKQSASVALRLIQQGERV